jgi:hypothetical protein
MQEILISNSKKKLKMFFILALVFVSIGIYCLISNEIYYFSVDGIDTNSKQLGYFLVAFFGLLGVVCIHKMNDKSPKLLIHQYGITDKIGNIEIYWKDIKKVTLFESHGSSFIQIHVHNPQEYLDNQTSTFKRKAMWLNNKIQGTPIALNTNALDISTEELVEIIEKRGKFTFS